MGHFGSHFLSLLVGLLFSAAVAWAAPLTRAQCEPDGKSYDYSSHFGPVRDQDGHGMCWAFASAGLLEEDLCIADAKFCGKHLSVLDNSRVAWSMSGTDKDSSVFQDSGEGGNAADLIRAHLSSQSKEGGGVCLEEDSPYANVRGFGCTFADFVFRSGPACLHQKVSKLFYEWRENQKDECQDCKTSQVRQKQIEKMAVEFKELLPEQERLGVDFNKVLTNPEIKERLEFLKAVLITPKCEKSRIPFRRRPNPVVEYKFGYQEFKSKGERDFNEMKYERFLEGIKTGRSVGFRICALQAKENSERGPCGNHAIIATGSRWNAQEKRCEIQMRNSWGKGGQVHGWMNADDVMAYVFGMEYIQ